MASNSDVPYISQAIKKQSPSIQTDIDEQTLQCCWGIIYTWISIRSILSECKILKKKYLLYLLVLRSGVGIPELLAVLVGLNTAIFK